MIATQVSTAIIERSDLEQLPRWARIALITRLAWKVRLLGKNVWYPFFYRADAEVDLSAFELVLDHAVKLCMGEPSAVPLDDLFQRIDGLSDGTHEYGPLAIFHCALAAIWAERAAQSHSADEAKKCDLESLIQSRIVVDFASDSSVALPDTAVAQTREEFAILLKAARTFKWTERVRIPLSLYTESLDLALPDDAPVIVLSAVLEFGANVDQGRLVEAVATPWYDLIGMIRRDPGSIYHIDPFKWEEIIAGAYKTAGFDEVILTPRSSDRGRDVIATKHGWGSIRFLDQVKAYSPDHVVSATDVRAMLGVISSQRNVSKGIITTTSRFAPRLLDDEDIRAFVPHRLELKPRDQLLAWLSDLRKKVR